jgi:hypothetical protein
MRNTTHIMVDIETMSTASNAAILSIGACAFDPAQLDDFDSITDRFYTTISIESNEAAGRDISGGTIAWWLQQSKAAQEALFEPPIRTLHAALTEYRIWADELRPKFNFVWANDPDFDCVILKNAADATKVKWPFPYYLNRSVRTIKHLAWPNDDAPNLRVGTVHHRAVDDAVVQALYVQLGWNQLVILRGN